MIIKGLTNEQYRDRDAISASDVKAAAKSLAHWKGSERKETTAFDLGTAYHELVLEPHKGRVVRGPENRRGKAWSDEYDACAAKGNLLITSGEYDTADMMAKSAMQHSRVARLINDKEAMIEQSIFATCPETGLNLKTRPDCYVRSEQLCLDLKSTIDAGPGDRDFASHIWKYKYDIQAAFYKYVCELAGLPVVYFAFCATEKTAPYATCFHLLSGDVLDRAHNNMMNILRRIKRAKEEDNYPTDWPEVNIVHLPQWLQLEEEE